MREWGSETRSGENGELLGWLPVWTVGDQFCRSPLRIHLRDVPAKDREAGTINSCLLLVEGRP